MTSEHYFLSLFITWQTIQQIAKENKSQSLVLQFYLSSQFKLLIALKKTCKMNNKFPFFSVKCSLVFTEFFICSFGWISTIFLLKLFPFAYGSEIIDFIYSDCLFAFRNIE